MRHIIRIKYYQVIFKRLSDYQLCYSLLCNYVMTCDASEVTSVTFRRKLINYLHHVSIIIFFITENVFNPRNCR